MELGNNMEEIARLEELIRQNAQAYYEGRPCISDDVFDHYAERLRALYPQSELLKTTGWGMKVLKGKQAHLYGTVEGIPDKIRPGEVIKRMSARGISPYDYYTISVKLDGASVLLYYKEGCLVNAISRGDGVYGEGIMDKMRFIVPCRINKEFTGRVRGEFIISRKNHLQYYPNAKSPRNTASGMLLRDAVSEEELKRFDVICYNVLSEDCPMSTKQQYEFLQDNGFVCVPFMDSLGIRYTELNEDHACERLISDLGQNIYDCDGLVINYEGKNTAIKWNTDGSETMVRDITWEASRLGKFTPVVHIESLELSGAIVKKVTGFNYDYIVKNKLGVGSMIKVVRSGDVIPYITEVCAPSEDSKIPSKCPYCGSVLQVSGVNLCCQNSECSIKGMETLLYFIHNVFDVDGLGDVMLEAFFRHFNVKNIEQFLGFCTTYTEFNILRFCNTTNGFGSAAFSKFVTLLNGFKKPLELSSVIKGLGLPNLGDKTVRKILNKYDLDKLSPADFDNGLGLEGVNYLAVESLKENLDYILKIVKLLPQVPFYTKLKQDIIYSKVVCVTGPLSIPRREFLELCESVGIQEGAIGKADFLVTNSPDSGTTKNMKAVERGIPVLSEKEFWDLYLNVK